MPKGSCPIIWPAFPLTKNRLRSSGKSGRNRVGMEVMDTIMVKAMRIILIAIMIVGFGGGGHCDRFSPNGGKPPCHKKLALTSDAGPLDSAPCRMAPCPRGKARGITAPQSPAPRAEKDRRGKSTASIPCAVAASGDIAPFLFPSSPGRYNALSPPAPPLILVKCSLLC